MINYPTIPGEHDAPKYFGEYTFVFYKYDGTNIRVEIDIKSKKCKFFTKSTQFDQTHMIYGKFLEIFNIYFDTILKMLYEEKLFSSQKVNLYFEFFGDRSFAGGHFSDDKMQIRLFDIQDCNGCFLPPKRFVDLSEKYKDIPFAELIFSGLLDENIVNSIKSNNYNLFEGAVLKGSSNKKVWMFKIKTEEYKEKLKLKFSKNWERFL